MKTDFQITATAKVSSARTAAFMPLQFPEVEGRQSGMNPAFQNGFQIRNPQSPIGNRSAFSLVEVMVVISLLSLIVLVLMNVFSSTQTAFRHSITQQDTTEGSRAAADLMSADLRSMSASGGVSNGPVNFWVFANSSYTPLLQKLPGTAQQRANLLNGFFVLSRENTTWRGFGYIVNPASDSPLYPLYRFYAETNTYYSPQTLFDLFNSELAQAFSTGLWTNRHLHHVVDGAVHLTVRAYDPAGRWINAAYTGARNILSDLPVYGEAQFYMFSNTLPASVELELGVLEDRTLARAESLPNTLPAAPPNDRRSIYLQQQAGKVHVFRQRVTIQNVDTTAYQP